MASDISNLRSDYFVFAQQHRATKTWAWEIGRRSKPMGVRVYHTGFASEAAAKLAGEKSLHQLLADLVAEKNALTRD